MNEAANRHKLINEYIKNYETLLCLNEDKKKKGVQKETGINKSILIDFTEFEALKAANQGTDYNGYEKAKQWLKMQSKQNKIRINPKIDTGI